MNVVTRANREIMESNHTCCSQIVLHMGKETEQQVRSPGLLCRRACGNNNTHGECREVELNQGDLCFTSLPECCTWLVHVNSAPLYIPVFQESSPKHSCRKVESLLVD